MKPAYEEFRDLVKKNFMEDMDDLTEDDVEEFLSEEENEDIIRNQYDYAVVRLEKGEIDETVFRNGCVSAAAYSLEMLY